MTLLGAFTFRGGELWPICLLALALVGLSIVAVYGPQSRLAARPWHVVLPLLRGGALVAVAVSMLRPVVTRTTADEERGSLLLLIDHSKSMDVSDRLLGAAGSGSDRRRSISRLVSLADSLGRLPEGVRERGPSHLTSVNTLSGLADDVLRARRELEYARLSGRDTQEALRRLEQAGAAFSSAAASAAAKAAASPAPQQEAVDRLKRLARRPRADDREWFQSLPGAMDRLRRDADDAQAALDERLYDVDADVRQACDELSRLSRFELVRRVFGPGSPVLRELRGQAPVLMFSVGDTVAPMSLDRKYEDDLSNAESSSGAGPAAAGSSSDLAGGLARAVQRAGRGPIRAVVMVSDGRHVGPPPRSPAASLPADVPVFTVAVAAPETADLALARVDVPESLFVGEELTARVRINHPNLPASRLTGDATLSVDGATEWRHPLIVRDGRLEALELKTTVTEPGFRRLRIDLPIQRPEATAANNSAERLVKVLSQRLKVLAVGGSPGWDFRYVRRALARAPSVELREVLTVAGAAAPELAPRQIREHDVVLLADVPPDALTPEQWDAVRRLVHERGGGVIFAAGPAHLRKEDADHPLADLLPYDPRTTHPVWRVWPGETAYYHAVPGREGERVAALALDADPVAVRRRWEELPGFYQYMAIGELRPGTRTLLVERESQAPLLTENRVGRGRALFFGMNETWRWRNRTGPRDQDRFWLQLIHHAAMEPYAIMRGRLSVDAERLLVRPGEPVRLRARVFHRPGEDPPPAQLSMFITQRGMYVRGGTLDRVGDDPYAGDGTYAMTITNLAVGEYELYISGPDEVGIDNDIALPVQVRADHEAELADVTGDRAFLQQMADATGGRCISLEEAADLPRLIAEQGRGRSRVTELQVWQSPYLFVFVLSCLAAEWALRKRLGLA